MYRVGYRDIKVTVAINNGGDVIYMYLQYQFTKYKEIYNI